MIAGLTAQFAGSANPLLIDSQRSVVVGTPLAKQRLMALQREKGPINSDSRSEILKATKGISPTKGQDRGRPNSNLLDRSHRHRPV